MVSRRSIAVALLCLPLTALAVDVGRAPLAGGSLHRAPIASATSTTMAATPPHITSTPTPAAAACTGAPLTSQSQVQPNTAYCGGVAHAQIILANGDTWSNGEVTGNIPTGSQQGALECGGVCTLNNMNVHDVPASFATLYARSPTVGLLMTINGGRYSGAGSLGIGSSWGVMHASGVEIDHNGATANCGFEGGGWKGVGNITIDNAYVHDNHCQGLWSDGGGTGNITNSRVVNNDASGIFIEISNHWTISGNTVTGNGFKTNGNTCAWLWGGGITVAASSDVTVSGNTVSNNCNGITGTQQNRGSFLLQNLSVHDNVVTTSGVTGLAQDVGDDAIFTSRNNHFVHNSYKVPTVAGHWFSWLNGCCLRTWTEWRGYGQDLTSSIS